MTPPKEVERIQKLTLTKNGETFTTYYPHTYEALNEKELFIIDKLNELIDAYNQLIKQDEKLSK